MISGTPVRNYSHNKNNNKNITSTIQSYVYVRATQAEGTAVEVLATGLAKDSPGIQHQRNMTPFFHTSEK